MTEPLLAAMVYEPGQGATADATLAELADHLRRAGLRLAGAIQHNAEREDRCRCDMMLEDLATRHIVTISEFRGPEARGCRLNPIALEEAVGLARAAIDGGAELLIVNRYGKREVAGHGFRQAIEAAVSRGTPVLVAVAQENAADWDRFAAGLGTRLGPDPAAMAAWCISAAASRQRSAAVT